MSKTPRVVKAGNTRRLNEASRAVLHALTEGPGPSCELHPAVVANRSSYFCRRCSGRGRDNKVKLIIYRTAEGPSGLAKEALNA